MEIIYKKESFNYIWGTMYNVKIEKDEEIPQTIEFKTSYVAQQEFAKNYNKLKNGN